MNERTQHRRGLTMIVSALAIAAALGCSPADEATRPAPQHPDAEECRPKDKENKPRVAESEHKGGHAGNPPVLILPETTPAPMLPESVVVAHSEAVRRLMEDRRATGEDGE